MKYHNMLKRRRLITAIILLVGMSSAVLIYVTAEDASDSGLVYEFEHSKKYIHDLEIIGGKANVLADEFSRWFAGLWQGKALAYTVACFTLIISIGFFFFAADLKSDTRTGNDRA
jgi:hypothetical protein